MAMNPRTNRWSAGWLANSIGLAGAVCLAIAAVGLAHTMGWLGESGTEESHLPPVASDRRVQPVEPAANESATARSYYPLEVGRYWVYVRRDPASGTFTEVERRIVRRESRPGQDLYYFSDGVMAYQQDGRIFEIGPEGGFNVIPVEADAQQRPYVYSSQSLHIEKTVGAPDTLVVWNGRSFPGCLQVITRFRREDRSETRAYASYYARGIGLIGRELWPPKTEDDPNETLKEYGPGSL